MNSIWLIIWRFQPLHKGHSLLIEKSLVDNPATLILVGSINKTDENNPYDYELRKSMIQAEFSEDSVSLWALPDFPDDEQWKDFILSYIPDSVKKLTLYCWDVKNDSAVRSLLSQQAALPFTLIIKEIPRSIIPVSATQIREWIQSDNAQNLKKYLSKKTLLFLGVTL